MTPWRLWLFHHQRRRDDVLTGIIPGPHDAVAPAALSEPAGSG
jgi:hypothetical protein